MNRTVQLQHDLHAATKEQAKLVSVVKGLEEKMNVSCVVLFSMSLLITHDIVASKWKHDTVCARPD